MGVNENERWASLSPDGDTPATDGRNTRHWGSTLGILIAALLVAEISKDVLASLTWECHSVWFPISWSLYLVALGSLPFLLVRMAPKAAGFDMQWLPAARRHWAWFAGMIFALFIARVAVAALTIAIVGGPPSRPSTGPVTPTGIVLFGIMAVFIAPVTEEIFFRGYVLDQFRELTRPGIAVAIQALLFGLYHLYTWGLFTSLAVVSVVNAFVVGIILGVWRIKFKSFLPLMLAHALCNVPVTITLIPNFNKAVERSHPKYTISEQTTHITEPLKEGGFVDYVAALNRQSSRGVTPKNNAAVPFWKAVGPDEILPEYRERYFQMLGIPPLAEDGDYFVDFEDYVKERKGGTTPGNPKPHTAPQEYRQRPLYLAARRPWSPQEFPVLAEWLAANNGPLAMVIEASEQSSRYDPLVCKENANVNFVPFPALSGYRDMVEALCARAMLRVHENRVEEAWGDLLACHRLARLIGQGPMSMDGSTARSCEEMACNGEQVLLQHAALTANQIAKIRADLNQLPAMPKMADRLDVSERYIYLDFVSACSRDGVASLAELASPMAIELDPEQERLKDTIDALIHYSEETAVDWDAVLRMGNSWYDRLVEACRKPTRAERDRALSKLDEEFRRLKSTAADAATLDELMRENPRQALSERLSQVLLNCMFTSWELRLVFEDRWIMRTELNNLAFALAAYHADHGVYPEKLATLVPDYAEKLPADLFSGSKLHYRREGTGYLLYSVGPNGKDDGGKGDEDCEKGEEWDDVSVRMAGPEETPQTGR